MKRHEFKEHTADIIAVAFGDSPEVAFAAAAEAMFDVITGGADVQSIESVELTVESIDREGLLVGFLSELIVIQEVQGKVFAEFTVVFTGPHSLRAIGRGESFDPERHGEGTPVKGVSYHLLEIDTTSSPEECRIQVLFDI
ncbi:MAG: archease [candidate division Zixibacteria bacterium]|nr:archease [candidate division Zixibacteria bacterium]